jgi:hypothetical protein
MGTTAQAKPGALFSRLPVRRAPGYPGNQSGGSVGERQVQCERYGMYSGSWSRPCCSLVAS